MLISFYMVINGKPQTKKNFKTSLTVIGSIGALLLLVTISSFGLIQHTIQGSRDIQKRFIEATNYVNNYVETNKHYPSDKEMSGFNIQPERGISYDILVIPKDKFSSEPDYSDDTAFVPADSDRYILSTWRGEWTEYYAYPSGLISLRFSLMDYFNFWGWVIPLLLVTGASFYGVRLIEHKKK